MNRGENMKTTAAPNHIPSERKERWMEVYNLIHDRLVKQNELSKYPDSEDYLDIQAYRVACGAIKKEMFMEYDWGTFLNAPLPEYMSTYELQDKGLILRSKENPEKEVKFNFKKSSVDIGLGVIYGIASKADVEDTEGDIIELNDLKLAAHDFMSESRNGDIDHDWKSHGDVVESLVMDSSIIDAVKSGTITEGDWFIGYKPVNPEVAKKAASGEDYNGFSIGGICRRVEAMSDNEK